jgi:hypothetical protein
MRSTFSNVIAGPSLPALSILRQSAWAGRRPVATGARRSVLDRVAGQLDEGLFQRARLGRQFVQRDARTAGNVADLLDRCSVISTAPSTSVTGTVSDQCCP